MNGCPHVFSAWSVCMVPLDSSQGFSLAQVQDGSHQGGALHKPSIPGKGP